MLITLDRSSGIPLYRQITQQLEQLIASGALPSGHRLPPERRLAETLGVNRTTILAAYRDLKANGFAAAHVGQGTVVTPPTAGDPPATPSGAASVAGVSLIHPGIGAPARETGIGAPSWTDPAGVSGPTSLPAAFGFRTAPADPDDGSRWKPLFSRESGRTQDTLTRDILALAGKPGVISFAAGIPIPDLDPLPELKAALVELIDRNGYAPLRHTPTEGLPQLRESLARYLPVRGIHAHPADLLILSGSQQGLDLLARLLIDPGDTVLVEEPTFFCARQLFEGRGAMVAGVPCDADGIRLDRLEAWLVRVRPKFLYVMPTFQNPTGRTMSLERRKGLLALARRYGLLIVEDDAYSGLRYEGQELPPLKALDKGDTVLYLGSFSKMLFMGLRIGWLHAPRAILRQVAIHRQLSDIHAASLSQWLVDACLRNGLLERHRQHAVAQSRIRRDCMLAAMEHHLADIPGIRWNHPEGGLYIWLTLPDDVPPQRVAACANRLGVAYVPGQVSTIDGSSARSMRLNFTFPSPDRIEEGIRLLGQAIREAGAAAEPAFHWNLESPLPIL